MNIRPGWNEMCIGAKDYQMSSPLGREDMFGCGVAI